MGNLTIILDLIQRMLEIWLSITIDSIRITRLSAAMTNTVYIISNSDCNLKIDEPRNILLRIYGEGVDDILNRSDEISWFIKLSKVRAGPRLLATFQNGRMEEYIESVTLTPRMMRDPEVSCLIAKAVSKFHRLELEVEADTVVLWKRIESWRHEAGKSFKSLLKRFTENNQINLVSILNRIKENLIFDEREFLEDDGKFKKHFDKLVSYQFPVVPCHNDLQHGNILLNDENKIFLIDYEYGGINYAAYDIANHFCEWASDFTEENPTPHLMNFSLNYPNIEERENFLRVYLEDSMNDSRDISVWMEAVEDFKEISHLLWAYWGIIQAKNSKIDFDYLGYSLMRLEAMNL
jgi:choline/ethanolamine kinase